MEKIDKMREVAGIILQRSLKLRLTLHQEGKVEFPDTFPNKELLCTLFVHYKFYDNEDEILGYDDSLDIYHLPWRNPTFVFHHLSSLIESETFSYGIIKGIISSSGGLTESTLKESTDVLLKYLANVTKNGSLDLKVKFMR